MNPTPTVRAALIGAFFATSVLAQDWTDEQLTTAAAGFQAPAYPARMQQVGKLMADQQHLFTALIARVHGDHREYELKVSRLLDELADPRWLVRENAERALIEMGSRGWPVITQKKEKPDVLEQQIRCARILDALAAKGTEQEERERRLLDGLVLTSLYLTPDPRLCRALRSALGHIDAGIADGALRALGKLGDDTEVDAVAQMVTTKSGVHRLAAITALGRMRGDKAISFCRQLLAKNPPADGPLAGLSANRTEAMAIVRHLHQRDDAPAAVLLAELAQHGDPVIATAARTQVPAALAPVAAKFTMPDRAQVDGQCGGFLGGAHRVQKGFDGVPVAEVAFTDCDTIDFPAHLPVPMQGARLFLNQGSLVAGEVLSIDAETVQLRSPLFGDLKLPRKDIQGIAFDPSLDRLVGASSEHDRVRLKSGEFVDGSLLRGDATSLIAKPNEGADRVLARGDVAGVLFTRPRTTEADTTVYSRVDLVTGERCLGFLGDSSPSHLVVVVPGLGATVLPLSQVTHMELAVGGGAMWGFTLIADYSDNRIVEVDDQGRVVFVLEEVFGAWDAECLDNGNLLITEFSVSRVQEVDRKGKAVWAFEDLKNPYDADRLSNGNTLIADTFGSRVIEVTREGKIAWSFSKDIRPFDCDRLPNGNTLIADVLKDRILEVSAAGEIVWELKGMPNAHDADRLPNGNTLITLRNKGTVIEVDRSGKIVFELQGLSSPSDADRLPNGNTLVAENTRVREFDRRGNEVWKKEMTWAVEVNRY